MDLLFFVRPRDDFWTKFITFEMAHIFLNFEPQLSFYNNLLAVQSTN